MDNKPNKDEIQAVLYVGAGLCILTAWALLELAWE